MARLKQVSFHLLALVMIVALVLAARHTLLNLQPPRSTVQRVTLLNPEPPKRPPPPAEVKAPEPQQAALQAPEPPQFYKYDEYATGGDSGTGNGKATGPSSDLLGLDTTGGAGSDSYGLVGKRGGQDITTLGTTTARLGGGTGGGGGHGQGGAMAKFAGYATMLKDMLTAELNRHDYLKAENYDAIIQVWIDADGRIKRVGLAKSTGMAKMDANLRAALAEIPSLATSPPPDMPQPINLRITSQGAVAAR